MKTENQEGKHTPERYTMDLRDSAPKTPGYVHVVDNDTRKIAVMFSTSLEARLINDMFDFMRAWPSQSSELSKREKEVERLNNYLSEANKENAKLGASLTEREQEVERLKETITSLESDKQVGELLATMNDVCMWLSQQPTTVDLTYAIETLTAALISKSKPTE